MFEQFFPIGVFLNYLPLKGFICWAVPLYTGGAQQPYSHPEKVLVGLKNLNFIIYNFLICFWIKETSHRNSYTNLWEAANWTKLFFLINRK